MPYSVLNVHTRGQGLYEITHAVQGFLQAQAAENGLLTVFVRHTSCSLLIQENADPDVKQDLLAFFQRLVPPSIAPEMNFITHRLEGPDDMPAHIKAALTQTSISIPVMQGEAALGTWQGVYVFEHRNAPHQRQVVLQFLPG